MGDKDEQVSAMDYIEKLTQEIEFLRVRLQERNELIGEQSVKIAELKKQVEADS